MRVCAVETLVVDEVRRMKIITEILRMPEDEPGIRRLVDESADALAKLQEVALGRSEADHYGRPQPADDTAAAAGASTLAPPASSSSSSQGRALKSPTSFRASPVSAASSPSPSPSASASPSAARDSSVGPAPTLQDYRNASIPALAAEMVRRKEGALEELDDRCLTSDNANDFMTVGGLEPLLLQMTSKYDGLRWRAAQALSTMVQNNPKAQLYAFNHNAIDYLVPLLTAPPPPPAAFPSSEAEDAYAESWTVVVKALTALSALVRSDDHPMIRAGFMQSGGFDRLATLLECAYATSRVQTKVFLFFRHVFAWFPSVKAAAVQRGLLPRMVAQVASGDINHRETLLRALLEFATPSGSPADQSAAKELRHKSLGLKERLQRRVKDIKAIANREDKEQAEDELTLCNALSKACKF